MEELTLCALRALSTPERADLEDGCLAMPCVCEIEQERTYDQVSAE